MNGLRRFLGVVLYVAMAFPLMLGGMALVSVRPLVSDPAAMKDLLHEDSLIAVLESPSLVAMAPESISIRGQVLNGKAVVSALQSTIPAPLVVATARDAIDSAFAAFGRGDAYFLLDARPLSDALDSGAAHFAASYASALDAKGASTDMASLNPEAVAKLVSTIASDQPEYWNIGEAGSRMEFPARLGRLGSGLSGASLWLLLTGTGLCFASVMISNEDWRRRMGMLGSRVLVPSIIILIVGLGPKLIIPGKQLRLPYEAGTISFPELLSYLKFLGSRMSGGFLVTGLIGLGVGTALATMNRILPLPTEEDMD